MAPAAAAYSRYWTGTPATPTYPNDFGTTSAATVNPAIRSVCSQDLSYFGLGFLLTLRPGDDGGILQDDQLPFGQILDQVEHLLGPIRRVESKGRDCCHS